MRLLDALSGTGVRRIEAVSFVHPKAIPQMADADEVWAAGRARPTACATRRWCPTPGAPQRALAAGFTEIEVVVSASDTHNRRNVNRSTDESLDDIAELIACCTAPARTAEVIVATSFGCPYEGDVDPARVAAHRGPGGRRRRRPGRVRRHHRHGDARAGSASCSTAVRDRHARRAVLLHFHNTRGTGAGQHADRAGAGRHRVRRQRRRARRLPVRAGRHRQRGHRGGRCTCCTTWASTPASTWTR